MAIDRLEMQGLDRAHVITTFFFCGIGSGHRMRQYYDSLSATEQGRANCRALVDSLGLTRDDPFCVGWGYGWDIELGKGE